MLCPRCDTPLDVADETAFCASCRGSLQSHAHVAQALGLKADGGVPLLMSRPALVLFPSSPCPACGRGSFVEARVLLETVAQCDACHAWWLDAGQLAKLRAHQRRNIALTAAPLRSTRGPVMGEETFDYDTPIVNALCPHRRAQHRVVRMRHGDETPAYP